ncbi:uncharacterized protein LOC135844591 isoform X2 [Planococcus citri]|uniref:uncharacterized protein LOC135844591 isoform X2 n=1 Tax=Planococcus citri TaxID=170843 RepID=UPI0031F991F1
MVHRCCVSGCSSRDDEVRMHKFPTNNATNKERLKIWFNHCRREEGWIPSNRSSIICVKHFDESQYEIYRIDRPPDNRKLRQTAIPTLFPGVPEPPRIRGKSAKHNLEGSNNEISGRPKSSRIRRIKPKPVEKSECTENQLEESNDEISGRPKSSRIRKIKPKPVEKSECTENQLEESDDEIPGRPKSSRIRRKIVKPVKKCECTEDQLEKSNNELPGRPKSSRISRKQLHPVKKSKRTENQLEESICEFLSLQQHSKTSRKAVQPVKKSKRSENKLEESNYETEKVTWQSFKNINIEGKEDEVNNTEASNKKHQKEKRGRKATKMTPEKAIEDENWMMVEEYEVSNDNQMFHLTPEEMSPHAEIWQPESKELLKEFVDEEDLHLYTDDAFNNDLSKEDTTSPKYAEKLHDIIKKHKRLIKKLCDTLLKLKKSISTCDTDTQTDPDTNDNDSGQTKTTDTTWKADSVSIEEMVKEAAEDAMKKTGFVYESTSGLYYDYNTGYYYNAEMGLYYDGNSGTYYRYDESTKSFEFHSQVEFPPSTSVDDAQTEGKRKKKSKKNLGNSENVEDELTESLLKLNITDLRRNVIEVSKAWPPCMRIIVKETNVKNLKTGTLFMITYDGGTLGREGDHPVLIPDVNISKYHAKFSFDTKDAKSEIGNYTLTDLGSRNGTFIDGKRLSTAMQESEPHPVLHDTCIRVGGTTLLCHVHPGRETCPDCEPGLLLSNDEEKRAAYVLEENMSEKRKNELRKLKKKFGFKLTGENNVSVTNPEYKDRAEIRRQTVGSHSDSFKTEVASVTQPIKKTNKGFKMLAKMGWSEGESLGAKSEEGITEPILVQQRVEKVGLGYDQPVEPELSKADKKKQEMWKKTQIRYHNLPSNQTS